MNPFCVTLVISRARKVFLSTGVVSLVAMAGFCYSPLPALAHHALGGNTPANALEGFLSGLAHPVIGLDHLAFVIAVGLLTAALGQGLLLPVAFVVASLMGTGLHLMAFNLPAPELVIAASVVGFGGLLAMGRQFHWGAVLAVGAIAGLFHGYAYGEAIIGAEMGPLMAYLAGFAVIQLAISLAAYGMGYRMLAGAVEPSRLPFRFAGFVICGVGITFLTSFITDSIFPV